MYFAHLALFSALFAFSIQHELLSKISSRRVISLLLHNIDLNNTDIGISQIVRLKASSSDLSKLKDYLDSADYLLIEKLWNRIETKRCLQGVPCKERDDVMQLYLSEESKSLQELEHVFRNLIDVEDIYDDVSTEPSKFSKWQHIFYIVNIVLAPLAASIIIGQHRQLSIPVTLILAVFLSSMIITYLKMYQERLAARMAASSGLIGDPCAPPLWYQQIGMTVKGLFSNDEKTTCQRFIESQTGSAFFDVSPTAVVMDVVSHFIFGWLGPLGKHLNTFWKELFRGVPVVAQFCIVAGVILVLPLVFYFFLNNITVEGIKRFFRSFFKAPKQKQIVDVVTPPRHDDFIFKTPTFKTPVLPRVTPKQATPLPEYDPSKYNLRPRPRMPTPRLEDEEDYNVKPRRSTKKENLLNVM